MRILNTGFPKKDARSSKIKNIPDLLRDGSQNSVEYRLFLAIGRLLWETLYFIVFKRFGSPADL